LKEGRDIDLKMNNSIIIPLSAAGAAALLSLATGFISGVGTAQMLVRGIFSAILTAGFVFLAIWLIQTFLPELTKISDNEEAPEEEAVGGSRVNIVMPDEMPSPAAAHTTGGGEPVNGADTVSGTEQTGLPENKIAESRETVHNNKLEESDPDRGESPAHLDVLPDLDSLEISVGGVSAGGSAGEEAEEPVESVTPSPSAPAAQPVSGDYGDPEDIAKAIKTVVARDQQK
jgi:hypothetical protein